MQIALSFAEVQNAQAKQPLNTVQGKMSPQGSVAQPSLLSHQERARRRRQLIVPSCVFVVALCTREASVFVAQTASTTQRAVNSKSYSFD